MSKFFSEDEYRNVMKSTDPRLRTLKSVMRYMRTKDEPYNTNVEKPSGHVPDFETTLRMDAGQCDSSEDSKLQRPLIREQGC